MNQSYLSRLEKLETTMTAGNDQYTIVRGQVWADQGKPAAIQPEVIGARVMRSDWTLDREPGEPLDTFIERARVAVPRSANGVAAIHLVYGASPSTSTQQSLP